MAVNSKALKSYFVRILVFSLFIPFIISVTLLWTFVSNTNEKIKIANNQLKRTYDLEITDSFHKFQSILNIFAQSEELKFYFNSTIDSEKRNKDNLIKVIQLVLKDFKFQGTKWFVINSRGLVIIHYPQDLIKMNLSKEFDKNIGVTLDNINDGSVAKKDHMRVKYLPWIVIGGSRDGFQVETYRANDYNNGSPLVSSLLIKL